MSEAALASGRRVVARVGPEPLAVDALLAEVAGPDAGATTLFLGTVRHENGGRDVTGIRYDAYADMARGVLAGIGEKALEQVREGRGAVRVAVAHRTGELEVGEASVAIAVAAAHRAEAFAVCRYVIEEIKVRLPVWKNEHYANGESRWLDGAMPPKPEAGNG